jgi:hypothetical protein
MLTVELGGGYLTRHERIALSRSAGSFLLPVTIADGDGRVRLMYLTEGYVTFREYGFHGDLYRVFRALKSYIMKIYEAQDMLLRPERIFMSGDKVFVSSEDCGVRITYGAEDPQAGANGASANRTYGAYTGALLPVLAELSAKPSVTGAKQAMTQLAKKIRAANPDYETAVKIIESVERRWNYMQPVGP